MYMGVKIVNLVIKEAATLLDALSSSMCVPLTDGLGTMKHAANDHFYFIYLKIPLPR